MDFDSDLIKCVTGRGQYRTFTFLNLKQKKNCLNTNTAVSKSLYTKKSLERGSPHSWLHICARLQKHL